MTTLDPIGVFIIYIVLSSYIWHTQMISWNTTKASYHNKRFASSRWKEYMNKSWWKKYLPNPPCSFCSQDTCAYIYIGPADIYCLNSFLSAFIADYFLHLALVVRFDFFPAGKIWDFNTVKASSMFEKSREIVSVLLSVSFYKGPKG